MTGLIAKRFGPGIAGLFLAFPAIFSASATLIEKHEKLKKQSAGFDDLARGKEIASVDAAGTAMGSLGLIAFALLVWQFLPGHSDWLTLTAASLTWFMIAVASWRIRKMFSRFRRILRRPSAAK
jgi:hypothetical protein